MPNLTVPVTSAVETLLTSYNANRGKVSSQTISVTFNDLGPDTIHRGAGSWIDDGFGIGGGVLIAGSASNNGTYTIDVITDATITLDAGDSVAAEGSVVVSDATFVDSDPDTITSVLAQFVVDGFVAGQQIVLTGTSSNDGTYTIDTGGVAAGTLTLVIGDSLATEAEVSTTFTGIPVSTTIEQSENNNVLGGYIISEVMNNITSGPNLSLVNAPR
jgi:hypothetical protein